MGLVYQRIVDKQGVIYINKQKIGMIIGGIALVGILGFTTIQVVFAEPVYPDWMKEPVEDLSQETMNSQFAFAADGYEDLETWQNNLAAQIQEQKNMINDMRASEYLYDEDAAQLNQLENDITNCLSIATLGEYQVKLDEMLGKLEERKAAAIEQARLEAEAAEKKKAAEQQVQQQNYSMPDGNGVLTASKGVNYFNGRKETYYNLDMSGVIANAHAMGIQGDYWVREDGCKMLGNYIMCAASDLSKGTIVQTSLGAGIIVDAGCAPGVTDMAVVW